MQLLFEGEEKAKQNKKALHNRKIKHILPGNNCRQEFKVK